MVQAFPHDGKVAAAAPPSVPEFLPEIINCKQEDDPRIQQFANEQQVALVAFIAPHVAVRVSPIH